VAPRSAGYPSGVPVSTPAPTSSSRFGPTVS
jgi:hypothetical protein